MKSLMGLLLLTTAFVGCNEKSSSDNSSRERTPICKSAACLPQIDWMLQTNLRPLDFKSTIIINDLKVIDECSGVHLPSVHIPDHRRSVIIEKFYYVSEESRIHVEIQSWDESCTVSTEFYNNTDTPVQMIREEGNPSRVVLDLDR